MWGLVFLTLTLVNANEVKRDEESFKAVKELEEGVKIMLPESQRHKIYLDVNSGCTLPVCIKNATQITVANLTVADKPNEERQHQYIWSVIKHPSVQVALTRPGNEARIDWSQLFGMEGSLDSSIGYQDEPDYSAAIMLANVSSNILY